jgi:uncharacterized damage-inducible protein DinB
MANKVSDPRLELLLKFIDQAFDKKAWHGPTLRGAIRGVTHKEALWRPSPRHHNIWELVIHTAYWKYIVRRRLTGGKRGSFVKEGSNWILPENQNNETSWKLDVRLLDEQHNLLRETIASLQPSKITNLEMIMGIASHDLYHAGQIQLLKRLIRGGTAKT